MVAQVVSSPHPVVACAEKASTTLAEALGYQAVYMDADAKRAALLAIEAHERRLAALKLRVMAASCDVAEADGARDVAAWLAGRTQADAAPLRVEQRLADAIDKRWPRVAEGMAEGRVSFEQARTIVAGLDALPARLGPAVLARAEAHLVELAAQHNPRELRLLARQILEMAAPEIAEGEEARRLEEEERRARDHCRLIIKALGDGSTRISGVIPEAAGERLLTYLHSFTSPRKHDAAISGEEDRIPYRRQLAQAFCALLEHLDPRTLPEHGGDATTLVVTTTLAALQQELGVGAIVGGAALSATEIRRLACQADIIPVVLGGKGEILDLGRSRRLYSRAQRRALALRDRRCRAEGCSIPARWCEAHHLKPWASGGRTDLDDGVLACSFHHHLLHDALYTHERLPDGDIRFFRVR